MDVLCCRCGEPWEEYFVLHEMEPEQQRDFWAGTGCPCCRSKPEEAFAGRGKRTELARMVQRDLKHVLGDDIDGLAAEMEDFGFT